MIVLETNIDDMSGEIYSYLLPKLLAKGALDVYLTAIQMKKNRPGNKLSVLAKRSDVKQLEEIIFSETTTLGIRKYRVKRRALERKFFQLESRWGKVSIKAAYQAGQLLKSAPEYEECKVIADEYDLPLREVYAQLSLLAETELKKEGVLIDD